MGGDGLSSPSKSVIIKCECLTKCQVCESESHIAPTCSFLYTACKANKCLGIRKLLISGTLHNPGRMFLKCQYLRCGSFQWLDEAISESKTMPGCSSSPKQHHEHGCFLCAEKGHWKFSCPWEGSVCMKKGCYGHREVKTSTMSGFEGQKYLMCREREDTVWLKDALKTQDLAESSTSRIIIDTIFDDFCHKFETKQNLKM